MSLTEQLSDPGSPVRRYLDGVSPSLADVQGSSSKARGMARALGLAGLAQTKTTVPVLPGVDPARSGTAIDFRARIALGGFDPHDSAAAMGVAELPLHEGAVHNGRRRTRVLTEAFDVAARILEAPTNEADVDRAAILLAHCEQVYRSGSSALASRPGVALDRAGSGLEFALGIDEPSLADVRALMKTNAGQLDDWRERIAAGERFEPNPVFSGSALVGGADADWMVGNVLIESKAYGNLTVPKLRGFLRQLLGYAMLDLNDALGIRSVGLWLPRQGLTRTWSLDRLLGGDPEELLPKLREGFRSATRGQQLASRAPVTQQRKHQVLADNRHTPAWMLVELAHSATVDIRFRAGRNSRTPRETVRELARDKYAKVRVGVARNEKTPVDVLEKLFRDTSVGVRRAAAANPRTPKEPAKALGQGRSAQTQPTPEASAIESSGLLSTDDDHDVVWIEQDRDDAALESRWFADFLVLTRGGTPWGSVASIPLPEASQHWAWTIRRSLDAPDWLKAGLPDIVTNDLMREGRPAWVRRAVAEGLPVSDPLVRDRLLADVDPEIRWSTLCRTAYIPDDALGELLGRLAAVRKERTRFRTTGDDSPSWARNRTPAEYEKEVLKLVASHPSTPLAALRELMDSKTPDVVVALMDNPALPAEDLAALLSRLGSIRPFDPRARLAASNRIPAAVAEVLVDDRDARVRYELARNGAVSAEVLARLAEDHDLPVLLAVLVNPCAPAGLAASIASFLLVSRKDAELLDVLRAVGRRVDLNLSGERLEEVLDRLSKSRERDPDMRLFVARDERTGEQTLARLATSTDGSVRSAVADNPRTPSEALKGLAIDSESGVRAAAAGNESLAVGLLITLAYDDDPKVRAGVAKSQRLDPVLLGELLTDKTQPVRSAAFRNPSTRPDDKAKAKAEWDRVWRESAPSRADLEEMLASTRSQVRMRPAYDSRTPVDVLAFLGGDRRSAQVRRAVAANPNTPTVVLASLAEDEDDEVLQAVAFNGATPARILAKLAGSRVDLGLLVALNPDAPTRILDALVQDTDPMVAYVAGGARADRVALPGHGAARAQAAIGAHGRDAQQPAILP